MGKVMAIVKGELVVDYAYPCMMAEKALKELHEAMLHQDFDKAKSAASVAITETALTLTAIQDMESKVRK
jgi:hypothetical protein